MRLPYAPPRPAASAPSGTREIYERISSRRHPRPLIPLDLTLLHSPALADGYNAFIGALRSSTLLPADIFELAVCRVAVLTSAVWEWEVHSKLALRAGVSRHALQQVLTASFGDFAEQPTQEQEDMDGLRTAMLDYVDRVTIATQVPVAAWERLQREFEQRGFQERELVELTVTIAGYNAVSRILVPLDVGERNELEMVVPKDAMQVG